MKIPPENFPRGRDCMKKLGIAYFDCFSGISGDMVLGALVDAGASLRAIEAELRKLSLENWKISAEPVQRGAVHATYIKVETQEEHHHRDLSKILARIEAASLPPQAADHAEKIFTRLAEAEARVHQVPVEEVHFHEVGAVDSIVDIVGAAVGFDLLGISEFACSSLDVGGGQVKTQHGVLPVPAPATAELLRGAPTYSSGIQRELVTPTGAAIAAALSASFGQIPPMYLRAIGYGAGSADNREKPNVLRLLLGEREVAGERAEAGEAWDAPVTVIETNLDDMSPQIFGYITEKALELGALDVFSTPVQMKKGRPGVLLTVLCRAEDAAHLSDLLFLETTTIGVRLHETRRRILAREQVVVATPFGDVRMKIARRNGSILNAAPEFDDCRRIASERDVPLKQVMAAASLEFARKGGKA